MSLQLAAQHLASKGRGNDKLLVHMTPKELESLQSIAMAHGGSLTINPETGLPEAGFLSSILPVLAGFAIDMFLPGVGTAIGSMLGATGAAAGTIGTGLLVGGGTAAVTGDIKQGLMAGLGAYGGAGLSQGIAGAALGVANAPLVAAAEASADPIGNLAASKLAQEGAVAATPWETLSSGVQGLGTPAGRAGAMSAMGGFSGLARTGLAAAAPMMGEQTVAMPEASSTDTGMIREAKFHPAADGKPAYYTYYNPVPAKGFTNFQGMGPQAATNTAPQAPNMMQPIGYTPSPSPSPNPYGNAYNEPFGAGYANGGIASFADGGVGSSLLNPSAEQAANAAVATETGPYRLWEKPGMDTATEAQVRAAYAANPNAIASGPNKAAADYWQQHGLYGFDQAVTNANAAAAARNPFSPQSLSGNLAKFTAPPVAVRAPMSNAGRIQDAYAGVGRANVGSRMSQIDPAGLDFWTKQLASGAVKPESFQQEFTTAAQNAAAKDPYLANYIKSPHAEAPYDYMSGASGAAFDYLMGRAPKSSLEPVVNKTYDVPKVDSTLIDPIDTKKTDTGGGTKVTNTGGTKVTDTGGGTKVTNTGGTPYVAPVTPLNLFGGPDLPPVGPYNVVDTTPTGPTNPYVSTSPVSTTPPVLPASVTTTPSTVVTPLNLFGGPDLPPVGPYNVVDTGVVGPANPNVSSSTVSTAGPTTGGTSTNANTAGLSLLNPTAEQAANAGVATQTGPSPTEAATAGGTTAGKATGADAVNTAAISGAGDAGTGDANNAASGLNNITYTGGDYYDTTGTARTGTPSLEIIDFDADGNPVNSSKGLYDPVEIKGLNPAPDITPGSSYGSLYDRNGNPYDTGGGRNWDGDWTGSGYGGGMGGDLETLQDTRIAANGGAMADPYAAGGLSSAQYNLGGYSDGGRLLRGPGDGVSDSIPAMIGKKQPARLADGEFVIPARIVSELGNGSTEAGARQLYAMMERIQAGRKKTIGKGNVAVNTRSSKKMPA